MKKTLPNLKGKPYGGAECIYDPVTVEEVKNNIVPFASIDLPQFLNDYKEWAFQGHDVLGLEYYEHLAYSNGTTEVFDKFYQVHSSKRLRLWRGEYFYHQIQAREVMREFSWIDEDDLREGDVVVVSMPFSDTGNIPTDYDKVMTRCTQLDIPVLIDMAYLNISVHTQFNLHYDCIQTIATSLSKVFPVDSMRIGMRLNRKFTDDTLDAYTNQSNPYVNKNSVYTGHQMIKKFSNDWIYEKYKTKQLQTCDELSVKPSNCVIFGIDHNGLHKEYNRGGESNRLCFNKTYID